MADRKNNLCQESYMHRLGRLCGKKCFPETSSPEHTTTFVTFRTPRQRIYCRRKNFCRENNEISHCGISLTLDSPVGRLQALLPW